MRNRLSKSIGIIFCTFLLLALIGCQAVGGLDLNKTILKQFEVTHQETSQLFEIEIDFNDELFSDMDSHDASLLKSFQKITFKIDQMKMDESGNQLLKGSFSNLKGSIPFTFQSDKSAIRIDLDGLSRPLVFKWDELNGYEEGSVFSFKNQETIGSAVRKLIQDVAPYFVKGLPNPPVINVSQTNVPINGLPTNVLQTHIEMNGSQLGDWLSTYLENLVNDQEGLKATLRKAVEWMLELPPEVMEMMDPEFDREEEINIDEIVAEGFDELYPELQAAQEELASAREDEEWDQIFDEGVTLKADVYVDETLFVRKSDVELKFAPAILAEEDSPVRGIKVRYQSESWNVNGAVEIPQLTIPSFKLTVTDLQQMKAYQFVRLFKEDSMMYDILKNDLKVGRQSVFLNNFSEWRTPLYKNDKGTLYVPIRTTLSEFGVNLSPSTRAGEVRFYDDGTYQSVVLNVNSKKVTVNGESIMFTQKVIKHDGVTYAAADDLLGLLHATYTVSDFSGDYISLHATRDV
ncbi:MAG: stalk domain-containing protein [Candidatus Cohnella colombiensis]|uniref:Stalk domain-containing protein n=1 Tax=Candidatus Cohnella colombiensis TaxID=3121368 RepID=A0AA95ETZ3_9BACL|nr:MAG: stalk domain-containing protein [Cohnella sp.]